jgi:hypothetical protein
MLCRRTRCQSRSASRHETPTLSLLRRLVLTTRRSVAPPKKSTSANADVEKGTGKDGKARKRKPQRGGMRPELKVWWHSLAQQPRLNYATPPGSPQPRERTATGRRQPPPGLPLSPLRNFIFVPLCNPVLRRRYNLLFQRSRTVDRKPRRGNFCAPRLR